MRWKTATLGEVCDIQAGGTPKRTDPSFWNGDVPWVKISDMLQGRITETDECISEKGLKGSAAKLLPEGTLLVSIFATIGRTASLGISAATNQAIVGVIPKEKDTFAPRFLEYCLEKGAIDLQRQARGVAQANINGSVLKKLEIPLPPLEEQKRIAKILDAADTLRRQRRQALAELDTFLQSTFLDLFGDPVTNPKAWEVLALTSIVDGKYGIKAGPFGSSLKKEDYTSEGYRIYGQEQVIAGRFDIGNYYIDKEKYEKLKSCAVKPGDLLVSLVGSYGKILVVPEGIQEGIINPRLLKITPTQSLVMPMFLSKILQTEGIQSRLESLSHGGTMGILNAGILKQLQIPLPPLDLQQRFADIVTRVEAQKARMRSQLTELDTLFASLQQRAFNGEL